MGDARREDAQTLLVASPEDLRLQPGLLPEQGFRGQTVRAVQEGRLHPLALDRLDDVLLHADVDGAHEVVSMLKGGGDDDRSGGGELADLGSHGQSAHDGHEDIRDHQMDGLRAEGLQTQSPIRGRDELADPPPEEGLRLNAGQLLIFHIQHRQRLEELRILGCVGHEPSIPSGVLMVNSAPLSTFLASIRPPMLRSMICLDMYRPIPVPISLALK